MLSSRFSVVSPFLRLAKKWSEDKLLMEKGWAHACEKKRAWKRRDTSRGDLLGVHLFSYAQKTLHRRKGATDGQHMLLERRWGGRPHSFQGTAKNIFPWARYEEGPAYAANLPKF